MFSWLKSLFVPPTPAGAPRLLQNFRHHAEPLLANAEAVAPGHWRCVDRPSGFSPLFRIEEPRLDHCLITFRAELRSDRPIHGSCIELSCRLPGGAPLVSRTPSQTLGEDDDWNYFEVNQHLGADQQPSLLRLGLATEDPGTIAIRNVQLFVTPVD